jgi:CRP-like cAMP-binding protein
MLDTQPAMAILLARLSHGTNLDAGDRAALEAWPIRPTALDANDVLLEEGDPVERCYLLLSGILARAKFTADGQRQIVSFHFAGELLDLDHFFLSRADHTLQALTPASVSPISRGLIERTMAERPRTGRAFWRETLVEASIFREWVLNVGRRDARTRVAHLLCEAAVRLEQAGLGKRGRFEFALTQLDIGDATGLTAVHVNRTLRTLKAEGVIDYDRGQVLVKDRRALVRIAQFDPAYLHI